MMLSMMKVLFLSIFLALLTVLVLVSPAASSSENDFCTEDNCPEGTELIEIGESSVNWWSPYSVAQYLKSLVMYNIEQLGKRVYIKVADVVEGAKSKIYDVGKFFYDKTVKLFEEFSNKAKILAQQAYNKTAEFAGRVYEKIEEYAEVVRNVLREEFNSFFEIMWEDDDSLRENGMFCP